MAMATKCMTRNSYKHTFSVQQQIMVIVGPHFKIQFALYSALGSSLPGPTTTVFTAAPRPASVTLTPAVYPLSIETGAVLGHTQHAERNNRQ